MPHMPYVSSCATCLQALKAHVSFVPSYQLCTSSLRAWGVLYMFTMCSTCPIYFKYHTCIMFTMCFCAALKILTRSTLLVKSTLRFLVILFIWNTNTSGFLVKSIKREKKDQEPSNYFFLRTTTNCLLLLALYLWSKVCLTMSCNFYLKRTSTIKKLFFCYGFSNFDFWKV